MIRRAFRLVGRISTILIQRGSVSGISLVGRYQTSWCCAGMVYSDDLITMSGWPKPSRTPCHSLLVTSGLAGGRSFGSPWSEPPSTQRTIVSICSSLRDMSFLNCWTPTLLSMCQGGICRRGDAVLDGTGPRTGVLERDERHRRYRIRLVALLAFRLEDRGDVLREGHRTVSRQSGDCRCHHHAECHQTCPHTH